MTATGEAGNGRGVPASDPNASIEHRLRSSVSDALARLNCSPTLFLSAFALIFLAYAYQAIVPAFNADDMIQIQFPPDALNYFANRRWGYYFIFRFLLDSNPAPVFSTLLGTFCMTLTGFLAARTLEIKSRLAIFMFVLIGAISVYFGELFGFDSTRLVYPVGNLLAVGGVSLFFAGRRASGVIVMALSPAFYSASIELAAAVVVARTITRLTKDDWRGTVVDFLIAAAGMLASLVLFIVMTRVLFWSLAIGVPPSTSLAIDFLSVSSRLTEIAGILKRHAIPIFQIMHGPRYLPLAVGLAAILLGFFYLLLASSQAMKNRGPANLIALLVFSLILLLSPFFLIFANSVAPFSERSFYAYSTIHAFWAGRLLDHYAARPFREIFSRAATISIVALAGIVALGSAAEIAKRAFDDYLVSQADLMATNRIIARIEAVLAETPGAPVDPIPIAVIFERGIVSGPRNGLASARSLPWSREWIFHLLDPRFQWVNGQRYDDLRRIAQDHGDWPAKDSVFVHEGVVVVVVNK